jgi:tRNA threonylcarbamoyladenosine biosynthesis protein TsaE
MPIVKLLPNEAATIELGTTLASLTPPLDPKSGPLTVHLSGELGAGKSTLSRAWLRALGVQGAIKSPTYALVEAYELPSGSLLHLDLYRLSDAAELGYLGLDAYLESARLVLIEWPERASNRLPAPEIWIHLAHTANDQRQISIDATSLRGRTLLELLAKD